MGRLLLLFIIGGVGIVMWIVATAAKGVVHVGEKTADIFRSGREKLVREYGGNLRFTPEYERLLAFSLFGVMRADGKASKFEVGMIGAFMKLYREIVGRSIPDEKMPDRIKEVLEEISDTTGEALIAEAMPMLAHEKSFLMECVFQVAQWDGIHRNEQIFIQHLANEIGINLPPEIFEKTHKAGVNMTERIRQSNPELRGD